MTISSRAIASCKDINTENVKKLEMIWAQSTGALRGAEGQPIVIGDVGGKPMLFMVSGCPSMANCNVVQALDLTDPDQPKAVWNYVKKTDRDESAVPRACCDTVNRGLNYAKGKIITHTLDGFVIALDALTGKELWVVKNAYPEKGETETSPTLIAENLVIAGFGGDEFAARGRMTAYDLDTGKTVWTCHATGSDKDVCLTPDTNKANPHYGTYGKDLGISTYPNDDWKIGGGAFWGLFSYDPELKLVYSSTGNPGLWSPSVRCGDKTHEECNTGKWDNKWSLTIFARKVETGEVVWAYQMTPFDQWDYDGVNENMLTDMDIDGKKVKALTHFDRNGFAYVLDRTDGTLLRANKYVTVDWAEKIDLKTGRPIKVKEHSPFAIGVNTPVCPSAMGGKDQQPCAVDPKEPNMVYCPTNNWCMEDEPQERTHTQPGHGLCVRQRVHVSREAGRHRQVQEVRRADRQDCLGDSRSLSELGRRAWSPTVGSCSTVASNGDFRAVDRNSGKVLWSRKLGSGIVGNPMTYKVDGKQYVSVYAGIGGWIGLPVAAGLDLNDKFGAIGATAMAKASELDKIPQGGTLYTFRLSSD